MGSHCPWGSRGNKRVNQMEKEYVYWVSDDSFDYHGPYGTLTQEQWGLHGFRIPFDEDFEPIIKDIEGFGHFEDVEEHISSAKEFLEYLRENKKHIKENHYLATSKREFDELEEYINENFIKENVY